MPRPACPGFGSYWSHPAPVTLQYKIDLQELWSAWYGWDDILPEKKQQKWMENKAAITNFSPSNLIGSKSQQKQLAYSKYMVLQMEENWDMGPSFPAGSYVMKSSMCPSDCQAPCCSIKTKSY